MPELRHHVQGRARSPAKSLDAREKTPGGLPGEKQTGLIPIVLRGFHPVLVEVSIHYPRQQDKDKQEGGGSKVA
jgi:hypothetical protein